MAYTTATFTRLDRNADGKAVIVLTYTGNAGEAPIDYAYPIDVSTPPSADYMRGLAMARLAFLNTTANFFTGALPFVGTVLDTTTPLPAAPAPPFGAFVAATAPFTPGATPQDVAILNGSATKLVTVTRVAIMTIQNTAGINAWTLAKRSTANTGGTSAAVAAVPVSATYPAATASVLQYTANPTLGTLVGRVWTGRVVSPTAASVTTGPLETPCTLQTPITLSGVAQGLALNFGGVALPAGLSVQAVFWWHES